MNVRLGKSLGLLVVMTINNMVSLRSMKKFMLSKTLWILMTCMQMPCVANWTEWTSSSCDQPCSYGMRYKIRQCRFRETSTDEKCIGNVMEIDACFEKQCPLYDGCDCFDASNPDDYRGKINVTENGRDCFSWDHELSGYLPVNYPNSGLEENYCRNPNGVNRGPWCYSNRRRTRANFCNAPTCPTAEEIYWNGWSEWSSCSVSCDIGVKHRVRSCSGGSITQGGCRGEVVENQHCLMNLCQGTIIPTAPINCAVLGDTSAYKGNISRTIYGVKCQRWDRQTPREHNAMPSRYPEGDLRENYCRNPDGDKWPWCITLTGHQEWDYCDVPECGTDSTEQPLEVGCYEVNEAKDYRGSASTTRTGYNCQYWDSNTPNPHKFKSYQYPGKGLGHHNYCRAPDNDTIPWCITNRTGLLWEHCNVSVCGGQEVNWTALATASNAGCGGNPSVKIRAEPTVSESNDQRIVGGVSANKGSIPWQVALLSKTKIPICGASIIHSDWIMTAGHCLASDTEPSSYTGVAGRHWRDGRGKEEIELQFQKIILHESYDETTLLNDIALIKLSTSINFNNFIKPVCLPAQSGVGGFEEGEYLLVTGWGRINADGYVYSETLQQIYVPVVFRKECERSYPRQIYEGMICAGYMKEGGKDSCMGDSGGPMVSVSTFQQIGIVSWGHRCAEPNYPGVYTYVPHFVDWIENIMEQH